MSVVIRWALLAVIAVIYAPLAVELMRVWWTDGYAAQVMFVPAFSLVIAYSERAGLRASVGRGDARGLVLIATGMALLVIGRWGPAPVAPVLVLETISIAVTVAGVVLWWFGPETLSRAAFPVGFLAAMVPLPRPLIDFVTGYLQNFVAAFAAFVLDAMDIPVLREGRLLHLGTATLEVAEICNGLRFLAALLVITAAFAQMLVPSWRLRVVVVASAIPIAAVANALRVTAVALATHHLGPRAASGFIHDWIGKVVWALTLGLVMLLAFALRWHGTRQARRAGRRMVAPTLGMGNAPGAPRR